MMSLTFRDQRKVFSLHRKPQKKALYASLKLILHPVVFCKLALPACALLWIILKEASRAAGCRASPIGEVQIAPPNLKLQVAFPAL